MSVFTKTAPVGVDIPIQKMQVYAYGQLRSKWGLTDVSFDLYGRIYRNQKQTGYAPEAYTGVGEYKEVLFDDTKAALGFFAVEDRIDQVNGSSIARVALIMMVNLKTLYPGAEKKDEQVHVDVQRVFEMQRYGFIMDGFWTGIDNVLKEYDRTEVRFRDEWPLHCFRTDFEVAYSFLDCN